MEFEVQIVRMLTITYHRSDNLINPPVKAQKLADSLDLI